MQHIKALTAIANDGMLLKPYIIDKVLDQNGKEVYTGKREEIEKVASSSTTDKIKQLMYNTVNSNWYAATGNIYKVKNASLIGKTGTAQLVNERYGTYYNDDYNVAKSFMGMWPKDNPKVIIYSSVKRGSSDQLSKAVKSVVKNINKYLNIFEVEESSKDEENITVDN